MDATSMKLGRLPAKHDTRTLRFARYASPKLHAPPVLKWKSAEPWKMYVNDQIGDCAVASTCHAREAWSKNAEAKEIEAADQEVIAAYSAISGYDPRTGANDNGCYMLDVAKYWRTVGIAGSKIMAFASVFPQSIAEVQEAMWLFGGVWIGVSLPLAAQTQKVWSVPKRVPWFQQFSWRPGSWGGHAVYCLDYDSAKQLIRFVSWGEERYMTYRFFVTYVEECYAVFSDHWLDERNVAPNGFDLKALQSDLGNIGSYAAMDW